MIVSDEVLKLVTIFRWYMLTDVQLQYMGGLAADVSES